MSDIRIERDYPHPPAKVWRAVTDPALIPLWTSTGQGGRPVGFSTTVGTKFQFVAKPKPGWNGVVDCEVLEVNEPSLLRYWCGHEHLPARVACTGACYRLPAPGAERGLRGMAPGS